MSNQYYDPNGSAPHGAPMNSYHSGGAPDPRYRPRPPPQQQPPPLSAMGPTEAFYDEGNAFPDAASEQWPLPALPIAQSSPRPNSPSGNSRRPPPRPPRAEYQDAAYDQSRQYGRMPPGYGPPPRGPPSHRPHRGHGEWMNDAYMDPQRPYPPSSGYNRRPPPPRSAQSPIPGFPAPPQAMHYQQRSPRIPQGPPPPHPRRGPPVVHHGVVPPPITEEPGRMRAGSQPRNPPQNSDSLSPFQGDNAGRVKIPSYYFEQRGHSPIPEGGPISGTENPDSPMEPHNDSGNGAGNGPEQRQDAGPEPPVLIRQASLGKKTRPTLTTIKSGDKKRSSSGESASTQSSQQRDVTSSKEQLTPFVEEIGKLPGAWISETPTPLDASIKDKGLGYDGAADEDATAGAAIVPAQSKNSANNATNQRRSSDILAPVRTVSPVEPTSDEKGDYTAVGIAVSPVMTPTDLPTPLSPVTLGSRDNLPSPASEGERSLRPRSPLMPSSQDGILSRRPSTPPHDTGLPSENDRFSPETEKRKLRELGIDIAAVREAEARGSVTSLPDLIRRATRLATNLDRGKTASRMGLNFFDFNSSTEAVERLRAVENKNRRSASLSDMLTAFPAPGARDEVRRSKGNFSTMLRRSQIPSLNEKEDVPEKQERKYCGLPPQRFWLLLAVLILLVVAAIVIPVVLVTVPKSPEKPQTTAPPSNPALARCEQQLVCENGGLNIIGDSNSCSCLCINGYTGKTCTTHSQTGCTTMSAGSTKKATVGDDIPRLISAASPDFSIPLDAETLLGLFSKADMTCTSENALVVLSTTARRSVAVGERSLLKRGSNIDRRQLRQRPPLPSPNLPSPNSPSPNSPSPNSPSPNSPSPNSPLPNSPSPAAAPPSPSQSGAVGSPGGSAIDFARVAVLYIFQQTTELDSAATAQEKFQSYFSGRGTAAAVNPRNITLGNGFSCNLSEQSLVWTLSNGTTVAS